MRSARAPQAGTGGPPPAAWPEGPITGYVAAPGYEKELVAELRDAGVGEPVAVFGRLVLARGEARPAAWAQNVWLDPERIKVRSISDAARKLKERGRRWALLPHALIRRGPVPSGSGPRALHSTPNACREATPVREWAARAAPREPVEGRASGGRPSRGRDDPRPRHPHRPMLLKSMPS